MALKAEIIKKEQYKISKWSGGTTAQLAIYPKKAKYEERDFKWRLSSAEVSIEESTFTKLPEIHRIIMIIEGKLRLEHVGHHSCTLHPFQQDSFEGDWETKSWGKVRDFNLMFTDECKGKLDSAHINKDQDYFCLFSLKDKKFFQYTKAVYCVWGKINIEVSEEENYILESGDTILLNIKDKENMSITITGKEDSDIILADILVYK